MNTPETIKILGIDIDRVSKEQALAEFERLLDAESCSQIVTLNPEMVLTAQNDFEFANVIKRSELVFPDGIGLVYASRIIGKPLTERITGIDFCYDALKILAQKNKTCFFLGAKPGIAEMAAENIQKEIPGLKVSGIRDGYYKPQEEAAIVEEINASGAEMLCLALGSPKQEFFTAKYKDRLKCKVAIGIGGSFDVWSGSLKRAPKFYIDHNIEWLYRLIKQPSRINRMIKLPLFLIKVANSKEKQ